MRIFLTPGDSIGGDIDGELIYDRHRWATNLHHVVLTSGRVQRLERSVKAEARINICANLLSEALAGGEPTVPGIVPTLSLSVIRGGGCLSVSLSRTDIPFAPPVVTIGVAERAQCGAQLWRVLHDEADPHQLATVGQPLPPEPWCAERRDGADTLYVDAARWASLRDFECCLAWAFLDRRAGREDA